MYPLTKFGIPTSKNIGDMDRTRKRDGRTDGQTDGPTVRLLYASQSSFGGIKKFKNIIKVSNLLELDQDQYFAPLDHLQRFSIDDKSSQASLKS